MKAIIVGAGVIGLMQARELAQKGVEVVLLDKGAMGKEASWAGGGIISPLYPWRYSDPITQLATWSQAYYPELIESLKVESGIDPELSQHGLLMLSVNDEHDALTWAKRNASWLDVVDESFIYQLEPHLAAGRTKGLWMSNVGSVRNPRLLKALKAIVNQSPNIQVLEQANVIDIHSTSHGASVALDRNRKRIEGDVVIVAGGAWSAKLLQHPTIKIEPVKGQMLVFDAQPGLVNRVVLSDGKYVIPRRDGKVVAGSTLERADFDKSISGDAREALSQMALRLFPALAKYPISHQWSGLRPGSPKGVPYISELPHLENVFVNAGHFRNGLVLAPASVRLATSLVLGEPCSLESSSYAV